MQWNNAKKCCWQICCQIDNTDASHPHVGRFTRHDETCVWEPVCAHALDPSICRCCESIVYGRGTAPCLCHCTYLLFAGTSPSVCPWQPENLPNDSDTTLPPCSVHKSFHVRTLINSPTQYFGANYSINVWPQFFGHITQLFSTMHAKCYLTQTVVPRQRYFSIRLSSFFISLSLSHNTRTVLFWWWQFGANTRRSLFHTWPKAQENQSLWHTVGRMSNCHWPFPATVV